MSRSQLHAKRQRSLSRICKIAADFECGGLIRRSRRIHERQDSLFLLRIIQRVKCPDFVDPTRAVQSIQAARVMRREFPSFHIASPKIWIGISMGLIP